MRQIGREKFCIRCGELVTGTGTYQKLCVECRPDWKWCCKCDHIKAIEAFKTPQGTPVAYCYNPCYLEHGRVQRATPQSKHWYYIRHLKRKFDISNIEAERLASIRVCSICNLTVTSEEEARKRLRVDHCHEFGNIRDVVCERCNHALGALDALMADPVWAFNLQIYIDTHRKQSVQLITETLQ
jgi:hypothetical protein